MEDLKLVISSILRLFFLGGGLESFIIWRSYIYIYITR